MGWTVDESPTGSQQSHPDVFLQDIFSWTGSQAVSNGSYINFMSLPGIAKQAGGTANLTQTASVIKFPASAKWTQVIFSFRMSGTVGGASGTSREWLIQTRRPDGVTVVGSDSEVKVSGTAINNRDTVLASWTMDALDPFTVDGIQVGLENISGQAMTITSVSIRVQRVVNP